MNQNIGFGATINGKHTWKDYGLVVGNTDVVGMPKPKTLIVEIPGSSKRLDLTEALTGKCEFSERTLSFTLGGIGRIDAWAERLRAFLNDIHGKHVKVVLDSELEYYFEGRAEVKGFERTRAIGEITLEVTCDPYKWEITASDEDWLWDTFNFETGVIRDYQNIKVEKSAALYITGSAIPMTPTFIVSGIQEGEEAEVFMNGDGTKPLQNGANRFPEWQIPSDGQLFYFYGTYTVTVSVRGGSL
ncbi:MAG: hypothetical protein E6X18_04200 [Atopobium minutum]|mgnify:CR=1 FL=1|uniref:Uncharacterized protein n=1 Tax=Atopobium minutum 10063974 TaxID=997872 RepID=N2BNZ9_9ACTN|nr:MULTISPECIES: hypothetical protein [Atopobium]EMZ41931.1 hypothetical protein HMPREF1091_00905 [Atopobium minutum 10063974]ERL14409.1 hypothetical protein HMPREF1247_1241 [Atopobium sp. BV3Ac4]MDU4970213.1 hypothetical protein [Atopobium minutum]MDU5357183.1 hypothetical protein [Atopobium minutum]